MPVAVESVVIKHAVRCAREGCSFITREPSGRGWCAPCESDLSSLGQDERDAPGGTGGRPTGLPEAIDAAQAGADGGHDLQPGAGRRAAARGADTSGAVAIDLTAPWEDLPEDNPYRDLALRARTVRTSANHSADGCEAVTAKGTWCSREAIRSVYGYAPELHGRMKPLLGHYCGQHLWSRMRG